MGSKASETTIKGRFTLTQLNRLRAEFYKLDLDRLDPSSPSYQGIIALLDAMSQEQLDQIGYARIPFMSRLAINRIKE